jgi:hypothetical protein
MAYTKLFSTIVTSSIWSEDDATRIVWITMLALSNKDGEILAALPGLARMAGVSMEACQKAIEKFLGPDPHSRTKEEEGRRLEVIDGGWVLINHAKYRRMASDEERKEQSAIRQQRFRDRAAKNNAPVTHPSRKSDGDSVKVTAESRQISHADAESNTEADTNSDAKAKAVGAKAPRPPATTDEEWIQSLENDPTYQDLNIRQELGKMQRWCETNRQKPSRKRFVNWINRAEKPIGVNGQRQ